MMSLSVEKCCGIHFYPPKNVVHDTFPHLTEFNRVCQVWALRFQSRRTLHDQTLQCPHHHEDSAGIITYSHGYTTQAPHMSQGNAGIVTYDAVQTTRIPHRLRYHAGVVTHMRTILYGNSTLPCKMLRRTGHLRHLLYGRVSIAAKMRHNLPHEQPYNLPHQQLRTPYTRMASLAASTWSGPPSPEAMNRPEAST
jgi:hypothetical protein